MKIRADQMQAFERQAWEQFEQEMLEHSKEFSPRLTAILGDDQVLLALRSAMGRAWSYGFTNRGPIRLYIELMFLCGSHFDTDPQYSSMGKVLRGASDQMIKAENLHEGHNVYLNEVSGVDAVNVRNALRQLLAFASGPLSFSETDLCGGLHREMKRIFPQRYDYVGKSGISELIEEAKQIASDYCFVGERPVTLMTALMFTFGHGCANDPLYPWIAGTLRDTRIVNPSARARRLENKATTWLRHVLERDAEDG